MDQNLNNSQNEFLWKLLANPADEAHLYGFNLQRLVNDFPQSGLLQALLAHASEEKNLKQASVYFNAKSLYKLINAPATFADVAEDKIFVQHNIGASIYNSHEEQQQFIDSYTAEHEKHAVIDVPVAPEPAIEEAVITEPEHQANDHNEPEADAGEHLAEPLTAQIEEAVITEPEHQANDHNEPEADAGEHLAEPLTAQIEDSAPVEPEDRDKAQEATEADHHTAETLFAEPERSVTQHELTEPEHQLSEHEHIAPITGDIQTAISESEKIVPETDHIAPASESTHPVFEEPVQHISEGLNSDLPVPEVHHSFEASEHTTSEKEIAETPEGESHHQLFAEILHHIEADAPAEISENGNALHIPVDGQHIAAEEHAPPAAEEQIAEHPTVEAESVVETPVAPLRTEASLTLEERLDRILNEARGIPNPPLLPLNQVVETPPVKEEGHEQPPIEEADLHDSVEEGPSLETISRERENEAPVALHVVDELSEVIPADEIHVHQNNEETPVTEGEHHLPVAETIKEEYLPLSTSEHHILDSASDNEKVAEILDQDQAVIPEIEYAFDEKPFVEEQPEHNDTAGYGEEAVYQQAHAGENVVVDEDPAFHNPDEAHVAESAVEHQVTDAIAETQPENIIEEVFDATSASTAETFDIPQYHEGQVATGQESGGHVEHKVNAIEPAAEDAPAQVATEDAYSILPEAEAEAVESSIKEPANQDIEENMTLPEPEHDTAEVRPVSEEDESIKTEDDNAYQVAEHALSELEGNFFAEHNPAEEAVAEPNRESFIEEHTQTHEEPVAHSDTAVAVTTPDLPHDIEDEVFDEIVSIEQIRFDAMAANPEDETDKLIRGAAVGGDYFMFDRTFGQRMDATKPLEPEVTEEKVQEETPVAEIPVTEQAEKQDVSNYHDEKMPYSFMWWLNKTRKEHAAVYQPFAKPNVAESIAKARNTGDELQQQYYENIFHITSMEELDKSVPAPPKVFEFGVKRKEQAIIERFIEEEPTIKPQSSDKIDNENKAKKSSEDRDEMVTETLAAIYADQMLYHKAIASYKKLMLKFPEKSRYFASKIEQLEKKTS